MYPMGLHPLCRILFSSLLASVFYAMMIERRERILKYIEYCVGGSRYNRWLPARFALYEKDQTGYPVHSSAQKTQQAVICVEELKNRKCQSFIHTIIIHGYHRSVSKISKNQPSPRYLPSSLHIPSRCIRTLQIIRSIHH